MTNTTITDSAEIALFSTDARGLIVSSNTIRGAGNNGIAIWQSSKRRDGTVVADNTIEDIRARGGGTGENGNAIAVFRAGDVSVRGNHIRGTAFSAIRANSAANVQILGNSCRDCDDVGLYSEFDYEGCIMADNVVENAGSGISVTNFDYKHGRLASVRGNLLRNLKARAGSLQPQDFGIGLHVEGDTSVVGNIIEGATLAGIRAGWGPCLRNVAISANSCGSAPPACRCRSPRAPGRHRSSAMCSSRSRAAPSWRWNGTRRSAAIWRRRARRPIRS